eukprot:316332-Hanusia_phi.AAC.2
MREAVEGDHDGKGRISAMNETETKRKIMLGDRKSTSRALVTTYGAAYEVVDVKFCNGCGLMRLVLQLLNAKQSDQASVAPESSAASQVTWNMPATSYARSCASASKQSLKVYAERRGAPDFASASQISFTQVRLLPVSVAAPYHTPRRRAAACTTPCTTSRTSARLHLRPRLLTRLQVRKAPRDANVERPGAGCWQLMRRSS